MPLESDSDQSNDSDHPKAHRAASSPTATALRFVAGALTVAAIIGGAGWLIQQGAKKRRHAKQDSAEKRGDSG